MMASGQAFLLRRLREVLKQWPPDPSRKGRDLGEFLAKTYQAKFEEESLSNAARAREALESLEKLSSDHYRTQYKRIMDYSFSQEPIPSEALSNEGMKSLAKRSLWDKIMGR